MLILKVSLYPHSHIHIIPLQNHIAFRAKRHLSPNFHLKNDGNEDQKRYVIFLMVIYKCSKKNKMVTPISWLNFIPYSLLLTLLIKERQNCQRWRPVDGSGMNSLGHNIGTLLAYCLFPSSPRCKVETFWHLTAAMLTKRERILRPWHIIVLR